MRTLAAILLGIALLLPGTTPAAVTVYVDNQLGNDRSTGTQPQPQGADGPVRTITAALERVGKSGRIVIANTGQPYREMLSLSLPHHLGSPGRPLVIEGNGAVIDGTLRAAPGAWQHVQQAVFAFRPRRLTYQQLFEAGRPLDRARLADCQQVDQLQPRQWALCNNRIYFRCEEGRLPEDYDLRHAGLQTGLTLYGVRHVRIENLVFQGFQQDGINVHERVTDCELVEVECRANGRAGLSVGGASRVRVTRSNFYDNGRVQVRTEGLADVTMTDCDIASNSVPAMAPGGRTLRVDGRLVEGP